MDWSGFLVTTGEVLIRALLGGAGAGARIRIGIENGEVYTTWALIARLTVGAVASATLGTWMYEWAGIPGGAVYFGSLLIGVVSWAVLVQVVERGPGLVTGALERGLKFLSGKGE